MTPLLARMMHLQSLIRAMVAPRDVQFIRLSPNRRGRLYFYSKTSARFFSIRSRGISDSRVADQIFTHHDYQLPFDSARMQRQMDVILSAGNQPLIIDCGAHIGLASRYFAEQYPQAQVVGLEPNSASLEVARQNCAGLENIELQQAAIGSREGYARIVNPAAEPWGVQCQRTDSASDIPITSISQILATRPESRLAIVKIDIEGFETDLFESNLDWIDECPLIIIELHDWLFQGAQTSANFIKAISGRNRDFIYRGENVFSIRN